MLTALFYLQYHSIKNRLVGRLTRLKQPKYLFGAIVGGIYFYSYFFRHFVGRRQRNPFFAAAMSPQDALLVESLAALVLLILVLAAWLFPHQRAALSFTEAEVAFLFPAPISRRFRTKF